MFDVKLALYLCFPFLFQKNPHTFPMRSNVATNLKFKILDYYVENTLCKYNTN